MSKKLSKEEIQARARIEKEKIRRKNLKGLPKAKKEEKIQLCSYFHSFMERHGDYIFLGGTYSSFTARLDNDYYSVRSMKNFICVLNRVIECLAPEHEYAYVVWTALIRPLCIIIADKDTGKQKMLFGVYKHKCYCIDLEHDPRAYIEEFGEKFMGLSSPYDREFLADMIASKTFEAGHAKRIAYLENNKGVWSI